MRAATSRSSACCGSPIFPGDAAPRALALAGVEMLAALDPAVRERIQIRQSPAAMPAPRAAAAATAATRAGAGDARADRSLAAVGIAISAVRRDFLGAGNAGGWGGRVDVDRGLGDVFVLGADVEVAGARTTVTLGEASALLMSAGAFGGLRAAGARVAGSLSLGARFGLASLDGTPAGGSGAIGGSALRPWWGPALAARGWLQAGAIGVHRHAGSRADRPRRPGPRRRIDDPGRRRRLAGRRHRRTILNGGVSRFAGAAHQEGMTTNKAWLGLTWRGARVCGVQQLAGFAADAPAAGAATRTAAPAAARPARRAPRPAAGAARRGAPSCAQATCLRPYTCKTACGGPIISNNCCQCEPPAFDDFMGMACGGSGGRGGAAGGTARRPAGSAPGGSGGAGGSGSAGRGGSGGGRGRGGGRWSRRARRHQRRGRDRIGGTGGNVDGGTDAFNCARRRARAPTSASPRAAARSSPTTAASAKRRRSTTSWAWRAATAARAPSAITAAAIIGGLDRIVVAKRDTSRNLCVNVVLVAPQAPPAGLTLPANYGLQSASVGPASACPTLTVQPTQGGPVTGKVEDLTTTPTIPATVNVDLIVTLPGADEAIITQPPRRLWRRLPVARRDGA